MTERTEIPTRECLEIPEWKQRLIMSIVGQNEFIVKYLMRPPLVVKTEKKVEL